MSEPRKVQFCSGEHGKLDGWENYDRDCDISKDLPFQDNSVALVFCEHGLEHISPQEGLRFLMECFRILEPGGAIRICVPEIIVGPGRRLSEAKLRDLVLNHEHKAAYNADLLRDFLWLAGFSDVKQTGREVIDSHLKCIGVVQDDAETLRMEAFKL